MKISNKITKRIGTVFLACALLIGSNTPLISPTVRALDGGSSTPSSYSSDDDLKLKYDTMAGTNASGNAYDTNESFYKALPLGNGRIGAMVYGNYPDERIELNEATFWSGGPGTNDKAGAADKIAQAQQLEYDGKYTDADNFINANLIGGGEAKYQSVGDLELSFGHTNVTNYSRQLDMNTGVVSTDYTFEGKKYHRESFVSFPDQVMVTKITCDAPGSVSLSAKYGCTLTGQYTVSTDGTDTLVMDGHGDDGAGVPYACKFQTRSKIINTSGTVSADSASGSLSVANADSVVILTSVRTNFVDYKTTTADQKALATADIASASAKTYDTLYNNHEADYQKLFKRADVDLGGTGSENDKPMGQRISEFATTQDPKLAKVLFQYGRYLMISASREGGQPMNLQGIWNKFRNPAWDCKLTTNINYEMNYWPAFTTNLAECFQPFVEKAKTLAVAGQYTAKNTYGVSTGWVVNHNTDIWNRTAPIDGAWGLWPTGAGWISDQLYDAYNFNQDSSYLSNIYPVIKGSADFLQGFMQSHTINNQDYQVICPSTSPEVNPPASSGGLGAATSYSVTMDNAISRSIFQDVIKAASVLNTDSAFSSTLQSKVSLIRPDQVGRLGQLQEWAYDWDSATETNRHISFAYNLFPGNQISKRSNPTIYDAVAKSLNIRGDEGTGWSEGWKLNCWARMEDGEHAYNLVKLLISPVNNNGRLYDNLWDAHPPFQIDGNFGFTSGVTEMLLQSQDNEINLLPALPSAWSTGHANGLCARGNFEVNQSWANGSLTQATITSNSGNLCNVRYGSRTLSFPTEKGKTYTLNGSLQLVDNSSATLSNVAVNKTATGSNDSSADAAKAVDGSSSTTWTDLTGNSMGGQWLQVDLGAKYDISRWVVKGAGYKNNPRDFKLQKSDNGTDWTDVDAVYGNEKDVNDRNVPTFSTRYARLLINTATQDNSGGARINELELWGVNEAENATVGGAASVITDANASAGKAVNLSAVNDSLTFANVPMTSHLTLGYSTASADGKLSLYVNDVHTQDITFPNTSGAYASQTVKVSIPANATVKLAYDSDDSAAKIDYAAFNSVDLSAVGFNYKLKNGVITGTTSAMEYSIDSTNGTDGTWTTAKDGNTYFTAENVDVYVREADNHNNFRKLGNIPTAPKYSEIGIEAESATVVNTYQGATWAAVPGQTTQAMKFGPTDTGVKCTNTDAASLATYPLLKYSVNFPTAGTYDLWTLTNSPDANGDSYHIGLDGTYVCTQNGTSANNSWVWAKITTLSNVSAGTHELDIWAREDGLTLDRILLTTNTGATVVPSWPTTPTVGTPVTGVTLNKGTLNLEKGQQGQLTANIYPSDATTKDVTWTSNDPTIATVDSTGNVTAVENGSTKIVCTTSDGSKTATCNLNVIVPVAGVTVEPSLELFIGGDAGQLNPSVAPADATNKRVFYSSSDSKIATVDSTGKVTAVGVGTTNITVTTEEGGKTAVCAVTAKPITVTGITVDPTLNVAVGCKGQVTVTFTPSNATNKNVTWETGDSSIATVDATGKVTGVAVGTTTVTATSEDGSFPSTCNVTVTPAIHVTGISIDPTSMKVYVGASSQLTATIAPSDASNKNVTWTSDKTDIATVDATGKVTGVSVGTATITGTTEDGNMVATCSVTVAPAPTNVALNKAATASGNNSGEEPSKAVDGSTDTKWCTDGAGKWLQIDLGGYYDISRWVVVSAGIKESTDLNTRGCTLQMSNDGKVWSNADTVTDNTATTMDRNVSTFTARYIKLIVDTPVQPNSTLVAARIHELQIWGVPSVAVTGVTVAPTSLTLHAGENGQLSPSVTPADAGCKNVTYTSDKPDVATVDATGKVTAVGVGSATITVTTLDGAKTAACAVTVIPTAVTGIMVNPTSNTIELGSNTQLSATIAPTNATNKNVTWSTSNSAVATVDNTGKVTAVAVGNATITATSEDGSFKATSAITVIPVAVTGVMVNPTFRALDIGSSEQLTATIAPTNATNKNVTWSTSNSAIATVDNTGKVTAVAVGNATITATTADGSFKATCAITVNPIAVTSVTVNPTDIRLDIGTNQQLTASVGPANATDKTVTWSTSDSSIATVDNTGKVTAVAHGTATITAKAGNKTSTCFVTVNSDGKQTDVTGTQSGTEYSASVVGTDIRNLQDNDKVNITLGDFSTEMTAGTLDKLLGDDPSATLKISKSPASDDTTAKVFKLVGSGDIVETFNIDLQKVDSDGQVTVLHELGSKITVTLKLTDEQIKKITDPKTAKLYYYDEATGKLVDMNAVFDLNAKTVTFTTDHFSKYSIVQEKAASATQPSTGDNTTTVPVALTLALAALLTLGTIIVVVKRKSHGKNDNQ